MREAVIQGQVSRRAFTVEEFELMAASGIFQDEHVELVEGEVVNMAAKGSRHAATVTRLTHLLVSQLGDSYLVRVQHPLQLSEHTQLEPDVAVVRMDDDYFSSAHPTAPDTVLVVEVAHSSLAYDRDVKLPLYARHGVPTVWLVDLPGEVVTVASKPSDMGYEELLVSHPGDTLVALPQSGPVLAVADILG